MRGDLNAAMTRAFLAQVLVNLAVRWISPAWGDGTDLSEMPAVPRPSSPSDDAEQPEEEEAAKRELEGRWALQRLSELASQVRRRAGGAVSGGTDRTC
eukprot:1975408-Rhodomonas_salina.3